MKPTAGRVSDLQSLRQAGDPQTNPNSMTLQPQRQSILAGVGQNSLRPPDKISMSMPTSVGPDRAGPGAYSSAMGHYGNEPAPMAPQQNMGAPSSVQLNGKFNMKPPVEYPIHNSIGD
jgi:hypothetical protein